MTFGLFMLPKSSKAYSISINKPMLREKGKKKERKSLQGGTVDFTGSSLESSLHTADCKELHEN